MEFIIIFNYKPFLVLLLYKVTFNAGRSIHLHKINLLSIHTDHDQANQPTTTTITRKLFTLKQKNIQHEFLITFLFFNSPPRCAVQHRTIAKDSVLSQLVCSECGYNVFELAATIHYLLIQFAFLVCGLWINTISFLRVENFRFWIITEGNEAYYWSEFCIVACLTLPTQ